MDFHLAVRHAKLAAMGAECEKHIFILLSKFRLPHGQPLRRPASVKVKRRR